MPDSTTTLIKDLHIPDLLEILQDVKEGLELRFSELPKQKPTESTQDA